jgi:hypothetical protein
MLILAAGGAVVLGTLGDKGTGDATPIAADEMRVIKLDGACPAGVTQETAKCNGGEFSDGAGGCACLTSQKAGTVDGEVGKADDLAPAKQFVKLVCPNPKDAKAAPIVVDQRGSDAVKAGCVVLSKSTVNATFGGMETDLSKQIAAACAPCPVTPNDWPDPCPRCILGEPGKSDCATLCKQP